MQGRSMTKATHRKWIVRMGILLGILTFVSAAFAQGGGNVAISGTVTDATGAVLPGAKVTVTQKNTSIIRTVVSNGTGQFNITSIPPATYNVTVEAQGFKRYVQDVVLLADQTRDMDIHLQVGEASQQVTVEESSVQVNTVSQELSQVIESSRVSDLPLNGRNAADLTLLVPGAVSAIANNSGALQGDTKQVPGAEAIAVNGARPDQIGYNLDGANNEDLMSNMNNPFPFPDALQEFSVQTNSFDAQYGNNAGAVVNVVTKSGTNQWHGDLFEFVRNGAFNARNYFADKVDPLKRNQFGGTIGGPIHKNTSFIFFGWQKTIIRSVNNASNAIVPTADNLNGELLAYESHDNDHQQSVHTRCLCRATPRLARLTRWLSTWPSCCPSRPAGSTSGVVTFGTPLQQDFNEYIARFDQVLHSQDRVFARFYLNRYQHAPSYDGKNLLTVGPGATVQTPELGCRLHQGLHSDAGEQPGSGCSAGSFQSRARRQRFLRLTDFGSSIWQLPTIAGRHSRFQCLGRL